MARRSRQKGGRVWKKSSGLAGFADQFLRRPRRFDFWIAFFTQTSPERGIQPSPRERLRRRRRRW